MGGWLTRRNLMRKSSISQIRRYGTNHLANRTLWHKTISQIGRYGRKGASHLRNPTPWHKPSRKSGEMVPWRRICVIFGPRSCHGVGFARWRGAILPYRRICEMEGRDSAIPSDLRDGEGPVSATASDLRDGSVPQPQRTDPWGRSRALIEQSLLTARSHAPHLLRTRSSRQT